MSVPNRSNVVQDVNARFPHLLRHNSHASCAEFLQRVIAAMPAGEGWKHLSKSEPENGYTFPGLRYPADYPLADLRGQPVRVSHDVIALPSGERVDIINGAGGHPAAGGPAWQVIPPEAWRSANRPVGPFALQDSGTPGAGESHPAILAFGWFCALRAFREWAADAQQDFAWIEEHVNPDEYRIFLDVEGLSHARDGRPDPWRDAGVDGRAAEWEDDFRRVLDLFGAQSRKAWCTVYGGRNHFPTRDDRHRFHDRIVRAAAGRWGAIAGFEPMNEYRVNYWTEDEVRDAGRDLQSKVPAGLLVALSSPNLAHNYEHEPTSEEMSDSVDALYGGSDHAGANVMTIHKTRDRASRWADPFSYNLFQPSLPKIDNEPFGPGASAGGDVADAALIGQDYQRAGQAGWLKYVGHCAWSVFNGRLPDEYRRPYDVRHVWEHTNMLAIAHALREVRAGGTANVPPGGGGTPSPHAGDKLLSGQSLLPEESIVSPGGHAHLHYQADGNLVVYLDGQPVWASHTDGHAAGRLLMQSDGNLVLLDASGPVRSTRTDGHPGAMIQLQDDGNFVLYDNPDGPHAGTPLWASATNEFFS